MKLVLILIVLSSCLIGKTVDPSIRVIASAIKDGHKVAFQGNAKYLVYNGCDTLEVNKASYSKSDWTRIRDFYRNWQKGFAELQRRTNKQVEQSEKPHKEKVYIIAREDKLYQGAASGTFGLDSTKVDRARRSIDKAQNQYWRVLRLRLAPADTVGLRGNPNIHYLVPYEASLDSLRNYLNDVTSRPKWTGEDI